jgi:hypothetical protein
MYALPNAKQMKLFILILMATSFVDPDAGK